MGKVKQAIDEVRTHIEEILARETNRSVSLVDDVYDVDDVKVILKNVYNFQNNSNPYFIDDKTVEELYREVRKQNEEY
jgi:hypothetical protein